MRKLLFDVKLMRPARVLLQAVAGGDRQLLNELFDSRDWLVYPTSDMVLINGSYEQWQGLANKLKK